MAKSLIFLQDQGPFFVLTAEKAKERGKEVFSKWHEQTGTGGPLGVFMYPLWNFISIFNTLKMDNPELKEQPAAATAYFSMLAQTPTPTIKENVKIDDWETLVNNFGNDPYILIGFENQMMKPGIVKAGNLELDAQTAYYYQIKKLQYFIALMGLGEGIEKTLAEQSRQAQKDKAAASASAQAAAYAAAMAKKAAEEVQISREEAAQEIAKANEQYKAAIEEEQKQQKRLDNIAQGLPADFEETSNLKTWIILGGIAAAGILLLKKGGK